MDSVVVIEEIVVFDFVVVVFVDIKMELEVEFNGWVGGEWG